MQTTAEILSSMAGPSAQSFSRIIQNNPAPRTTEELIETAKIKADRYNSERGGLEDYECNVCRNKGNIAKVYYDERYDMVREGFVECKCMRIRKAIWRMKASGLENAIKTQIFDTFKADEPWQVEMKNTAQDYAKNPDGWLFVGGQVGCGKTHICTAVCRELLRAAKSVIYMSWQSAITRLKSSITDSDEYYRNLDEYRSAEVLYIDDLFKPVQGQEPTAADIRIAYELINHRYITKGLTIVSSERTVSELINVDEAVGSRIYEMSKGHCLNLRKDANKNFRLREVQEL